MKRFLEDPQQWFEQLDRQKAAVYIGIATVLTGALGYAIIQRKCGAKGESLDELEFKENIALLRKQRTSTNNVDSENHLKNLVRKNQTSAGR